MTFFKKLLCLLCLLLMTSAAGCQYITPSWIKAGGIEIIKDNDETTPAKTIEPDYFEIEIIPPNKIEITEIKKSWYKPNEK